MLSGLRRSKRFRSKTMEAEPPEGLLYGAKIKLQHVQTGRRLHSHGARYPGG